MKKANLPAVQENFKPDAIKGLLDQAPTVFFQNNDSVTKAVTFGNNLIDTIEKEGMSDDLDAQLNKYLVRLKDTIKTMDERRKPITSMFQSITRLYTGLESHLDPKNPDSIYYIIQSYRNSWATKKAQEAERIRREQEQKLAKDQAKINVTAVFESAIRKDFDEYIKVIQERLQMLFTGLTLENFTEQSELIKNTAVVYPFEWFEKIRPTHSNAYLTAEEISACLADAKTGKFEAYAEEFKRTISESKQWFVDRLTSKYRQLHEIANANAEEQKRLKEEAEQKTAEEQARLHKEAEEKAKAAQAEIEANKAALTVNTMFDAQTAVAEVAAPPAKQSFEISVQHAAGWQLIFAKYFEKEGLMMPIDELGKKSLNQMKAFCEKLATDGEIINSPYLKYNKVFKAVAKR